ncbi:hypothetical protein AVEN_117626-1 [Araneus ventricosus]|uniref:Uncharacterized protein n=1 Tax=Araneus ventricosus TaxID=182803 RepID=A0A4Y2QYK2_ARAVE|nr:hypothetical protein AVEN_117626-1 [Araneus ventricosus]
MVEERVLKLVTRQHHRVGVFLISHTNTYNSLLFSVYESASVDAVAINNEEGKCLPRKARFVARWLILRRDKDKRSFAAGRGCQTTLSGRRKSKKDVAAKNCLIKFKVL